MPSKKQISTIGPSGGSSTYVTGFNPVLGGGYDGGTLYNETTRGLWWGSGAYNGADRQGLHYHGGNLHTYSRNRHAGYYIRCVSEEKTVTDLTYLQDMTGEIAARHPTALAGKNAMGHIIPLVKLVGAQPMKMLVSIAAQS